MFQQSAAAGIGLSLLALRLSTLLPNSHSQPCRLWPLLSQRVQGTTATARTLIVAESRLYLIVLQLSSQT